MVRSQASPDQIGKLDPGTELIVQRRGYRHHGIYVGNGRVIHYAGWGRYSRGLVEEIPLWDFAGRRPVRIGRRPAQCPNAAEIVWRARSRLGERSYHLLTNNCEHFCSWCQVGESTSSQVDHFVSQIGRLARTLWWQST